jgi:ABC-type methionine transport system ATPase subunit
VAELGRHEDSMAKTTKAAKETKRLWLTYPRNVIQRPVIYELGHKFQVVTNIRQASVTEEVGIVSLELQGERAEIKKAVKWLEGLGIKVEPVVINVIEG